MSKKRKRQSFADEMNRVQMKFLSPVFFCSHLKEALENMKRFVFVLMNEYRIWGIRRALEALEKDWPGAAAGSVYPVKEVNDDPVLEEKLLEEAGEADMAFIAGHGSIQNLHIFSRLWREVEGKKPVFFTSTVSEEMGELLPLSGMDPETHALLDSYCQSGRREDLEQMVLCALNRCFGGNYPLKEPCPPSGTGIFTREGLLDPEAEEDYKARMSREKRPVIGVIIHEYHVRTGNTGHVTALMEAIEKRGCVPFALSDSFAENHEKKTGILYRMEKAWRREDGSPIPCALAVTYGFSLTTLSGKVYETAHPPESVFEDWGLPVIQGLTTYFSEEEYRRDIRGLDLVSLPICVYQPEFDGQLISVPFAVTEESADGRKVCRPLPDRTDRFAELACRWGQLRTKPLSEKKIAIIFHNMPPRNDTIGSAHALDAPESVFRIITALTKKGFKIDRPFTDSAGIIQNIRQAVTNDSDWLSPKEALHRAAATVSAEQYQIWFDRLGREVQKQMVKSWGPPPGTVMQTEGKIIIPGMINGNLFIGLQPLRSSPEKAEELYHSTDSTPPHSYLAFYRWIDEIFKADAVLHVGTHGTLEWLPGKEVGLSGDSYGDICIGGIPHLYIYNISILGEGIQAKRRSYACIADHMIPSMDEADAYGELAEVDEAIDEYFHAKQAREAQVPELLNRIFTLAEALNLTLDLGKSRQELEADPEKGVLEIHEWVSRLKTSMVRDGLHIFGEPPKGPQFDNLVRSLTWTANGDVPGIRDAILLAQGSDPNLLPGEAVKISRRLFDRLSGSGYDPHTVPEIISRESFTGDTRPLKKVLEFACNEIVPKVRRTTEEMDLLLDGFQGKFVPPLPGGSPSRGNVHILPTGRNFYSIDPSAIPARSAWAVGQKLAKQAISAYKAERKEEWPESMAIVVYSDECMKTHGEDIAEVLALMGVKPVYLGNSSRVVGVEPIPLEKLGHPRIDVVLRISGLFRDTFPNVLDLIEKAVLCVVNLPESPEENFVRKHTFQEMEELTAKGVSAADASARATLRVFGCPPGTYGAGVNKVIHSRNWNSQEDLSRVYTLWSAHGYSSRFHGQALPELFTSRLSTVGTVIKNESSVEIDMLDADDFYCYHGGLMASVRSGSGKKPVAIAGKTADPSRPETISVEKELARVMRSRILNPKWLEGLKRHGYKGAQEISTMFDTFFGWDATAQVGENWMYDAMVHHFLLDPETRKWMEAVNDAAVRALCERFLEAAQRGMWQADPEDLEKVREIYVELED